MTDTKPTCNKTKYASRKDADEDIKRISKKSTRQFVPTRSYWCRICGSWHVTSQPENNAMLTRIKELEAEIVKLKEEVNKKEGISKERYMYETKLSRLIKTEQQNKIMAQSLRNKKGIIKQLNTRISKLVTENFMLKKWQNQKSNEPQK